MLAYLIYISLLLEAPVGPRSGVFQYRPARAIPRERGPQPARLVDIDAGPVPGSGTDRIRAVRDTATTRLSGKLMGDLPTPTSPTLT